jgi:hypothetical protein
MVLRSLFKRKKGRDVRKVLAYDTPDRGSSFYFSFFCHFCSEREPGIGAMETWFAFEEFFAHHFA